MACVCVCVCVCALVCDQYSHRHSDVVLNCDVFARVDDDVRRVHELRDGWHDDGTLLRIVAFVVDLVQRHLRETWSQSISNANPAS